jgi:hypothetical protein
MGGASMNEKDESEDFEDDEEETVGGDEVDIDNLFRDLEKRKKNAAKVGDPAWRRLEKYREERHTADLVSDFDDYDIESSDTPSTHKVNRATQ